MKTTINLILAFVLAFCLFTEKGFSQNKNARNGKATKSGTLVEVASVNPQLKTFVKAFKSSGIIDSLNTTGSTFTIFAPSNAAFDSLPDGAKEDLLKSENKDQLKAILRNHIVSGKISAKDLTNGKSYNAIGGQELGVSALGGKIMVGGVEVTKPNLVASDGIIHIVNKVIVPPSEPVDANK